MLAMSESIVTLCPLRSFSVLSVVVLAVVAAP
jgi:hypothetical protein